MSTPSAFNNNGEHPYSRHSLHSHGASLKPNIYGSASNPSKAHLQQSGRSYAMNSSNVDFNNSNDHSHSDYEVVAEFQLRREREKLRILEQRLHNKEIFIHQMKQYQDELTSAFQKCQEELILANKTIEQMHILERERVEEIADLKHLVIRLEDEITLKATTKEDKFKVKRHFSSAKAEKKDEDAEGEEYEDSEHQKSTMKEKPANLMKQARQQRSKTLMNREEGSPKGTALDQIEQQLLRDSKKISKFLKQFLMMSECFLREENNASVRDRLKLAWKWIKGVVKEWNEQSKRCEVWNYFLNRAAQKIKVLSELQQEKQLEKILKSLKSSK